jgi:hypothetical protein
MRKPRTLTIILASAIFIVVAGITMVIFYPFSNATRHPALLNSTWRMSFSEVENALGVTLSKDISELYFDIQDRPLANRNRYSSFGISSSNSKYGQAPDSTKGKASVSDFIHHRQWNPGLVRIEYWMIRENHTQFDPSTAKVYNPDAPFNPDEYLREKGIKGFVAMVRVTYLPIEKEINDIAEKEKKTIF